MLSPRKVKHRKQHKGRMDGVSYRGAELAYGDFALKAGNGSCGRMTAQQMRLHVIAVNRKVSVVVSYGFRCADKSITKKPAETRMGKGKGVPEYWVATIRPGRILYELKGIPEDLALEALRLASFKLPFPTTVISKRTSI